MTNCLKATAAADGKENRTSYHNCHLMAAVSHEAVQYEVATKIKDLDRRKNKLTKHLANVCVR